MKEIGPKRWEQLEALLDAALDRPAAERSAFLAEACGDDLALRAEVMALLDAGDSDAPALRMPDSAVLEALFKSTRAESSAKPDGLIGRHVGQYRLIRAIGRGGMGQVYLAVRDDDSFKRYVAVKVIRRGMDTDDILHRFRIERQILASLNHPNIARLLDGGATEEGLSYFVMEFIEGIPLLKYCDQHRLTVEERLRLFISVCDAVHYAHQNLIVHRDLKPSNILVTPEGQVKLLDFGIAKLLNPSLAGYTVPMTRTELRVMTPEYAAPEQIRGEAVTTSSDVYQLGVLLYELLTGHRPHELSDKGAVALEKAICDTDPPPPSTAIDRPSGVAEKEAAASPEMVSLARRAPTDRLRRRLEGDLDNIVLMALRKEPEHRYPSAEAFLEDVRRHLEGLPVNARRATVGYRVRKFVRRHSLGVSVAGTLVILLLVVATMAIRFAVVTSAQADRIALEAAKAGQVKDFLIGLFEELDPENAQGEEVTARELLERGADQIETELAAQPAVQAEMLDVMGVVYKQLGAYDKARPLLERSLAQRRRIFGEHHPEVAESLYHLAMLYEVQGDYVPAEALHREALAMRIDLLGENHPDVALSKNDFGVVLGRKDNYEEAEVYFRGALDIQRTLEAQGQPRYRDIAEVLLNLAIVLTLDGRFDEAEQLHLETLSILREHVAPVHPIAASTLYNLGTIEYDLGDFRGAERHFREAMAMREMLFGNDHPSVTRTINWVGRALHKQGRLGEAEILFHTTIERQMRELGEGHPFVGRSKYVLATLLIDQGEYEEAERLLRQAMATYKQTLGNPSHRFITDARAAFVTLYTDWGRPEQAALYRDS